MERKQHFCITIPIAMICALIMSAFSIVGVFAYSPTEGPSSNMQASHQSFSNTEQRSTHDKDNRNNDKDYRCDYHTSYSYDKENHRYYRDEKGHRSYYRDNDSRYYYSYDKENHRYYRCDKGDTHMSKVKVKVTGRAPVTSMNVIMPKGMAKMPNMGSSPF